MTENWQFYALKDERGVYAVLRADRGIVYRWQPKSKVWVDATWNVDQVYGIDRGDTVPITAEEAQALTEASAAPMFEVPAEDVKWLRDAAAGRV